MRPWAHVSPAYGIVVLIGGHSNQQSCNEHDLVTNVVQCCDFEQVLIWLARRALKQCCWSQGLVLRALDLWIKHVQGVSRTVTQRRLMDLEIGHCWKLPFYSISTK